MSETTASDVVIPVRPDDIPDGVYSGVWGSYRVSFRCGGQTYSATTSHGLRTTAAPCRVTVDDGRITVETL